MWGSLRSCLRAGVRLTSSVIIQSSYVGSNVPFEVMRPQVRLISVQSPQLLCAQQQKSNEMSLDAIVETLCGDNEELEKKLRVCMLEVEVMRQDGRQAPDQLALHHWQYLLDMSTRSQRTKYLNFLFRNEKIAENKKAKKEERKKDLELMVKPEKEYPDDLEYGLTANAMFLRIRESSINNFDNYNAIRSAMYGQQLVIDCSFDNNMVLREAVNAAKQVMFLFGDNRLDRDPFDIHICNVASDSKVLRQLAIAIPTLWQPWLPLSIHKQSYLDLFPKDKLVYLTPHCNNELVEFDHEAIYIVGCMVNKISNEPLSLAKAKRDGIKMAKLPLDRYLEWAPGSGKSLNINHMVSILLDLKSTGDWNYALRHVPRRKLMESKLEAVKNNMHKYHPKFIESLTSSGPRFKHRIGPRVFAGKVNMQNLFAEDNKY